MAQRSIIWFKTDLRLHDNETLIRALENSTEVIPVYCLDEDYFRLTEFGFQKTGNFRAQFVLESLAALDSDLRQLGSGLLVVRGKPEFEIYKIAREYKVQKIFSKKEVAYEETQKEEAVEKELWKLGCTLEKYSTSTLYHAGDLPFTLKDIPDVFSRFRKKVEKEATVRGVFPKPVAIKSPPIPPMALPEPDALGLNPVEKDERTAMPFKGGETAALQRLQDFLQNTRSAAGYKDNRNAVFGEDYATKFSAWLAAGCLSPRTIYHELQQYETKFSSGKTAYGLVFELLRRDFFRFMMKKHRRRFFLQNGISNHGVSLPNDDKELLYKWINGQTGNDLIDANMTELKLTGYISNRGRQNVASYLYNDLHLEWRYGAAYFEQQLIDYDVCNNWGNWAYVAGLGNDASEKLPLDIAKQAAAYDPDHAYRNLWLQKT